MSHSNLVASAEYIRSRYILTSTSECGQLLFFRKLHLRGGVKTSSRCNLLKLAISLKFVPLTSCGSRQKRDPKGPAHHDIKDVYDHSNEGLHQGQGENKMDDYNDLHLRYICGDFFLHLFSQTWGGMSNSGLALRQFRAILAPTTRKLRQLLPGFGGLQKGGFQKGGFGEGSLDPKNRNEGTRNGTTDPNNRNRGTKHGTTDLNNWNDGPQKTE